jgi:hypothetical protein
MRNPLKHTHLHATSGIMGKLADGFPVNTSQQQELQRHCVGCGGNLDTFKCSNRCHSYHASCRQVTVVERAERKLSGIVVNNLRGAIPWGREAMIRNRFVIANSAEIIICLLHLIVSTLNTCRNC